MRDLRSAVNIHGARTVASVRDLRCIIFVARSDRDEIDPPIEECVERPLADCHVEKTLGQLRVFLSTGDERSRISSHIMTRCNLQDVVPLERIASGIARSSAVH